MYTQCEVLNTNVADISPFVPLRQGFGFLSSIFFVVDMVLSYKSYQTQRAQETSPDQRPPQRQAGDVNKNYLKSPVFYAKLVEIVSPICITL